MSLIRKKVGKTCTIEEGREAYQLSYSQDLLKYMVYLLVDYFKSFLFDTYINSKALSTWNDMNMYRKTQGLCLLLFDSSTL